MKKSMTIRTWIIITIAMSIGGFLAMYIIGRDNGQYNFDAALAIMAGSMMTLIIRVLYSKRSIKRS